MISPGDKLNRLRVWGKQRVPLGHRVGVAEHTKEPKLGAGATCRELVNHFGESSPRLPQAGVQDIRRGDWDLRRVGLPDVVHMKRDGISQDPLEVLVVRDYEQFGLAARRDGLGDTFD
jgi:hypothetical protein